MTLNKLTVLFATLLLIPACVEEDGNTEAPVQTSLYTAGQFPNAIESDSSGAFYIVNSGDNTIQKIAADGTSTAAFIDTGDNTNPYDIAITSDRAYITNLIENSITVADLATGNILSQNTFPGLKSPQDILVTDDHILVANTEFDFTSTATEYGSLAILTRDDNPTLIATIPTTQPNPQFLAITDDALIVVNSGRLAYDPETFVATPDSDGGIDIFDLSTLASATAPTTNIAITASGFIGNPGRPAIIGDSLYIGSGTAPTLFKVDLVTRTLTRGSDNPITLYAAADGANALVAPFAHPTRTNNLYILDFNADSLILLDTATDTPLTPTVDLGANAELFEGPISLTWHTDGRAYFLNSVSSSVGSFDPTAVLP